MASANANTPGKPHIGNDSDPEDNYPLQPQGSEESLLEFADEFDLDEPLPVNQGSTTADDASDITDTDEDSFQEEIAGLLSQNSENSSEWSPKTNLELKVLCKSEDHYLKSGSNCLIVRSSSSAYKLELRDDGKKVVMGNGEYFLINSKTHDKLTKDDLDELKPKPMKIREAAKKNTFKFKTKGPYNWLLYRYDANTESYNPVKTENIPNGIKVEIGLKEDEGSKSRNMDQCRVVLNVTCRKTSENDKEPPSVVEEKGYYRVRSTSSTYDVELLVDGVKNLMKKDEYYLVKDETQPIEEKYFEKSYKHVRIKNQGKRNSAQLNTLGNYFLYKYVKEKKVYEPVKIENVPKGVKVESKDSHKPQEEPGYCTVF
jgi:hypothetical protein